MAVFQIGVAAQSAEPRAGRIHQHAVGFAGQARDAGIVLIVDALRVDGGYAGAGHARFEVGEALFGDVESINAAFVGHHGGDGQCFAAGAGAEIHHDFAALGAHQQSQKLAAFILHFKRAVEKQRVFVERDFFLKADAPR